MFLFSFIEPAQATTDCPHQFGYFRLGSATDCGRFMNCVNGRGYEFFCPDGLAYNEQTLRCDWPDQVPSCDAECKYLNRYLHILVFSLFTIKFEEKINTCFSTFSVNVAPINP